MKEELRRRELADFIRSRRERLLPSDVGLPASGRRRTPGLRREEVAFLTGVGTTWYTWLEQGRDVKPSNAVLEAISRALQLDKDEHQHLFQLSQRLPLHAAHARAEQVPQALLRMLESMTTQPAYVIGRRWDILAWNRAAAVVFGDYARLQGDERNIMHMVFANAEHRQKVVDWDILAPIALANFRMDSVAYAGDPDFLRLIRLLQAHSPHFRQWWSKHEVSTSVVGFKRILQPTVGHMVFEYTRLSVFDHSELKIVIYTPLEEENTSTKLNQLLQTSYRFT